MGGLPPVLLRLGREIPRVCSEAAGLFGCYGTLVGTYKGVWRSHARG